MANIAQIANVLQSMVLTKDNKMVLTPTYYVFKMYVPHQNATVVPLDVETTARNVLGDRTVPTVSATASTKDGILNITLTNIDLNEPAEVTIPLDRARKDKITGVILTAASIDDYNDFGQAEKVKLKPFSGYKAGKSGLIVNLPSKSIVSLSIPL